MNWNEEVFKLDTTRDFCSPPEFIEKFPLLYARYGTRASPLLRFILKLNWLYNSYVITGERQNEEENMKQLMAIREKRFKSQKLGVVDV